jgi:DNA-binding transcriptional MerR regulator
VVIDMLSIGELAYRTAVSRRMLRHWEEVGLLAPAEVDAWTGHRRYAPHQAGRVRAIATLRSVGFGLDAIGDLLASGLSEVRLIELLRDREAELSQQITEASARLSEVRVRLTSIEKGHDIIMNTLELSSLPPLELVGLQETVTNESEIGDAVNKLLTLLRERLQSEQAIVLTYDGTTDHDSIIVTAGVISSHTTRSLRGLENITIGGAARSAAIRYAESPSDVGDAWITLDAALEKHALRTTGVYRQTLEVGGSVTLQAPVVDRTAA